MLVSIIVPNYNHERYLSERLKSIEKQTYTNYEVIILDDKSTDESREVIKSFVDSPKVSHYIINEKNSGSTFDQWDKGINLAKGDYIWIAESDDVADPCFLEKILKKIQQDKDVGLCFCESYRMDSNGLVTGDWSDWTNNLDNTIDFKKDFIVEGWDFILKTLIYKNVIPNASAVVFRKDLYQKVGGANKYLKTNGDWDIWLKMCSFTKVAFVAHKLNYFRYHNKSVIAKEVAIDSEKIHIYMLELRYSYKLFMMKNFFKNRFNINKINENKINRATVKFSFIHYKFSTDKKYLNNLALHSGIINYLFFVFKIFLNNGKKCLLKKR